MNAPDPLITTIIPTFRRPLLLKRAIMSALEQTYRNLRVLVLDNASGDETGQVVRTIAQHDPRVQYRCHPNNIGAMPNFQAGMAAVETPYFSFLSDDDALLPHFYENAVAALQAEPRARIFLGQILVFNSDQLTYKLSPRRDWHEGVFEPGTAVALLAKAHFTWTSALFATEVRDAVGPLLPFAFADLAFLLKAVSVFPFVVRLAPFSVYTAWDQSLTGNASIREYIAATSQIVQAVVEHGKLSPEKLAEVQAAIQLGVERSMSHRLRTAFNEQDWDTVMAASEYLQQTPSLKFSLRIRALLASPAWRKSTSTQLVGAFLRWRKNWRQSRRKRRAEQEQISFETLMRQFAPPLVNANPLPRPESTV